MRKHMPRENRQADPGKRPRRAAPAKHTRITRDLLAQIRSGRYQAGDLLPSEPELCRRFEVSRHTVRIALRTLYEKGLIVSQQGRGSVVQASATEPRYTFACDSLADLTQYASTTTRHLLRTERIQADAGLAEWLGSDPGYFWWRLHTIRRHGRGDVIASSTIHVPDAFADAVRELAHSALPLFALMADRYGHTIAQVRQKISVATATAVEALDLDCETGAPLLCVERRFFDERGGLLEVSRSVHPPDAFQYEMTVRQVIGKA
jgi:DNA-binding GntR family transcriptional regulator